MPQFSVQIYADGADPASVPHIVREFRVSGFTTNPSLVAASGATNYAQFAESMYEAVAGLPLSLEVLADESGEMIEQGKRLAALGDSVFVKVPVTNTRGEPTTDVIRELQSQGISVNVTALFTRRQIDEVASILVDGPPSILSVFAGRIADAGQDPEEVVRYAVTRLSEFRTASILWASCREVFNVIQADRLNCDIITIPVDLLPKTRQLGRDLDDFSLETVRMFYEDARRSGLTL